MVANVGGNFNCEWPEIERQGFLRDLQIHVQCITVASLSIVNVNNPSFPSCSPVIFGCQ